MTFHSRGLVSIPRTWEDFKKILDGTQKALNLQYETTDDAYECFAMDGRIVYVTKIYLSGKEPPNWEQADIDANTSNRSDFETNFKNSGNKTVASIENKTVPTVINRKVDNASRAYVFSCDFTKRETWFEDAVSASDTFSGDGVTTTFQLSHGSNSVTDEAIVDLSHGKVTDEHLLAPPGGSAGGYIPVVTVDGVTKTEREAFESTGGDYEINYTTGLLTFYVAPASGTDNISVSYYYVPATAGPKVIGKPAAGKKWTITAAEVQFSKDVVIKDTVMQNVFITSINTPVQTSTQYMTMGNYFDFTYGSFSVIPAIGGSPRGTTQDTVILRWDYLSSIVLKSSQDLEMRIWTKHGRGFSGERATLTIYALEEDE